MIDAPHAGYSDRSRRWYAAGRRASDGKQHRVEGVVMHATAGRDGGDLRTLRGLTDRKVSIHYYVTNGLNEPSDAPRAYRIVREADSAWHVRTEGRWKGKGQVNCRTIGIELEAMPDGRNPYTAAQIEMAARLVAGILRRSRLGDADWRSPDRSSVVRHRDVQQGKSDPYDLPPWDWKAFCSRVNALRRAAERPKPAPKPAPKPKPRATLRLGDRGPDVKRAQQRLVIHGFDPGPIDGAFGNGTERAVRRFQARKGLTADGVIGSQTWAALERRAT